jgi:hypothetical protein
VYHEAKYFPVGVASRYCAGVVDNFQDDSTRKVTQFEMASIVEFYRDSANISLGHEWLMGSLDFKW